MQRDPQPLLETARLRAGEGYELVVFDRLADDERAAFAELAADPGFYGVLRPRGGGRTYRAVDRDTALLVLTLAAPGPLPFFARDGEAAAGVTDLILDGVLEIEHDGEFVAGARAAGLVAPLTRSAARHPLLRLSDDALRMAAALGVDDVSRLAGFLYDFNRVPMPAAWARRLSGREEVLAELGWPAGSPRRRDLEAAWELSGDDDEGAGWVRFLARGRRAKRADLLYKLYVSPAAEDLPGAVAALVDVLGGRRQATFKVAADAAGLFRPDKLVAYFDGLEELLAAARELERRLAGVPAQGVPFSAPIDASGLLSWGVDPPASARPLSWQGAESWRSWLAGRLGGLLGSAAGGDPAQAVAFALARLEREGVDVERWLPQGRLFRAA